MRSILSVKRLAILTTLLSASFLLNGCPAIAVKRLVDKSHQSQAEYVKIYTADQAIPAYTVVGTVTTDNTTRIGRNISQKNIDANLKVEARKVGANAVIVESKDDKKTTGIAIILKS
jgi:hypothetical protein